MHYSIIKDKEALLNFIEWLPELKDNEKFYCCLFSRKKYAKNAARIRSDKCQLKRFVSDKDRLFNKIEQLETKLGTYQYKGISVPQESLALYINPNPRNLKKAVYKGIMKLTQLLENNNNFNPHQELLSTIQKTKSRTCMIDFDFDTEDKDIILELPKFINYNAYNIVKTRGGYHILIKPELIEKEYKNSFHRNISAMEGMDACGDQLLPVPGCCQGDFVPRFVLYNHNFNGDISLSEKLMNTSVELNLCNKRGFGSGKGIDYPNNEIFSFK